MPSTQHTYSMPYLSNIFISTLLTVLMLSGCSGLDKDPTADWSAKDFYEEARRDLDAGEFQSAIKNLETLEARFPFDKYAKQAQLEVAYSYFKFEEPDAAISAADRFVRLNPRDPNIDYIYYLKGLINFERGSGLLDSWFPRDKAKHETETLNNAFNDFATLVRRFPDSRYAGDAYQRMIYLQNELAQHEIDVAEYYLKRKAWLGAANRAKSVLERYEKSAWRNRALEIMKTAYTEMGLDELAADTRRVIELNPIPSKAKPNGFDPELEKPPSSRS
jgi:outer membrane protein assembly factor BamD